MKLTKEDLKRIIKEELTSLQSEMMDSNYAESYGLDVEELKKIGTLAKNGDGEAKHELAKAIQLIGGEMSKLNPSGPHAMFYYTHVGIVDPDVDMSKISPDLSDKDVDLSKMYPEEEPEFY